MTEREIFANFVSQYRKPFDAEAVTTSTGIPGDRADHLIREFVTHERIKCLCEGDNPIWVRANRYNIRLNPPHGLPTHPEKAAFLLSFLERGRYQSVRQLAGVVGKSRQWVYLYLEAMMSVGVVGVENGFYTVGDKSRLNQVGTRIDKGIIRSALRADAERQLFAKQNSESGLQGRLCRDW